MARKSAPGPVGTSCLTCKQRHKKCDTRQPICLRCDEGGFECLGYEHNRPITTSSAKSPRLRSIIPKNQEAKNFPNKSSPTELSLQSKPGSTVKYSERNSSLDSQVNKYKPSREAVIPDFSSNPPSLHTPSASGTHVKQPGNDIEASTTFDYLRLFSPNSYNRPATTSLSYPLQSLASSALSTSSPSDPTLAYLNSADLKAYLISHFQRLAGLIYFKLDRNQGMEMYNRLILRLYNSCFSRWVMLLSAKILEALIDEDRSQTALHLRWIANIQSTIHCRLTQGATPQEVEVLHRDWLEISLLRTALTQSSNAYAILRNATPTFLQHAYSLPNLWSAESNVSSIPLINVISSKHNVLSSFSLIDCICAMVFGLPQQIEYDTSIGILPAGLSSYEWVHGTPTEFHILLAEINACRDKSPGVRNWREIEHTLVHWESRIAQGNEWESWMSVAWLAVQESWRLALLAYLYLAVCRLPSDDVRIQRCVTQILQVVGAVKKQKATKISVPFLIQYLIVGICARSEKKRNIIRNRLSDAVETKLWMMRGSDFVPVLDHLWHGAGANGHPITWDDYISSREAVLPVLT